MSEFTLEKDLTDQDWSEILGVTKDEFTNDFDLARAELKTLDDYMRSAWPDTVPMEDSFGQERSIPIAERHIRAIHKFYCSEHFSKWVASRVESLADVVNEGITFIEHPDYVYGRVVEEAASNVKGGSLKVLDHGCDRGQLGMGVSALHPNARVVLYDLKIPPREALSYALKTYARKKLNCKWVWAPRSLQLPKSIKKDGPFDLVFSEEVMEHLPDPVAELHALADVMKPGGLLHLSTFFNNIEGSNPQHLAQHHCYQDCELWFRQVEAAGFRRYINDPRGVLKVFQRV